ncbi:MAG: hypothetical protein M3277_09140 [Actinomycetota bacterium]|nr:hypothetical protein [Actinomycetota bacterium]
MFSRTGTADATSPVVRARGGISGGAVVTGVVVAFGAMFLMSALVGGVLAATGTGPDDVADTTGTIEAGIGAGIVLIVAQFLAYLWGGYTAGRMARGAGAVNGLLVPLFAIIIAIVVGAVVTWLGATANLNIPYSTARLPIEENYLVDWGMPIAIGALVAMFLGGALGGGLGAAWHTRLEANRIEEVESERAEARAEAVRRTDDARARAGATSPGNGQGATATSTTTPVEEQRKVT